MMDVCPWYEAALLVWKDRLGTSPEAQYALACKLHDVDRSTMKNYAPKWRQFVRFCKLRNLQSLPASVSTVVNYVGWMAERGTVRASSMTQYLSCISKAHTHVGLTTPVQRGGALIASIVDGMSKLQHAVYTEDEVMYLPAEIADTALDWAINQLEHVRGVDFRALTDPDRACLSQFRDHVALTFNFGDFGRADSQQAMLGSDISIDSAHRVMFRLRKVKGRSGRVTRLVFQWPAGAQPGLCVVLQCYLWMREQLQCTPRDRLWVLPFDAAGIRPTSTAKFDLLVQRVLSHHGVTPPSGGFSYSTRSIRAGAASAAAALNVPLPKIRHLGGWAPDSATPERVYIDPSCPPSPAGLRFFGWLLLRGDQLPGT